jgi:hypothetical protein
MSLKGSLVGWLSIPVLAVVGCAVDATDSSGEIAQGMEGYECVLDPVSVSVVDATQTTIEVEVCAGASGAPGGFTLFWSNGEECSATFDSPLDCNECINVTLGDLSPDQACSGCEKLECGTEYDIKGRAEADCDCKESDYSCPTKGSTDECDHECDNDKGCTLTQGYWKNHPEAWPVTSLMLGSESYTQEELLQILKTPVRGNGLISLAHQLIAAKLNIANEASDCDVSEAVSDADALIGSLVVPPIGSGSLAPSDTSGLTGQLDEYNNGGTGPGHCGD